MKDTTQETTVEAPTGDVVDASSEDKVETAETEGVEQEETTDAQEETTVDKEAKAEKEAEESLFKSLMEKKGFKSEEDLAKAYSELEGSFSRKAQETKELDNLLNALLDEDSTGDSSETETQSIDETERLKADVNLMKVSQKHPDLGEYAETMKQLAEKNPDAKGLFRTADGVELLYKMAKVEKQDELVSKAKEEGRNEVTAKEVEKLQGQVESDTKAKRSSSKVFTREQIRNMDPAEYDANREEILRQMAEGIIE